MRQDELVRVLKVPKGALIYILSYWSLGHRSIMEPFMRDVLFYALDISGKKDKNIVITKEMTEQYARNIMSSGRYEKV